MREIYKKATQVDTEGTTITYQRAMKELDTSEPLEQTPLTTLTEPDLGCKLSPGKKKLGHNNPDQAEQYMTETNKSTTSTCVVLKIIFITQTEQFWLTSLMIKAAKCSKWKKQRKLTERKVQIQEPALTT